MLFALDKTPAVLVNFNPRAELHGDEKMTAADIKLRVDLSNDCLAMFAPSLKDALYYLDKGADLDLVDQTRKDEPGYKPNLRFPKLETVKWPDETIGAELTIYHGIDEKSNVVLECSAIGQFTIEPKEGGTCTITFRAQTHPSELQAGKLCMMIGTKIDISIAAPEQFEE